MTQKSPCPIAAHSDHPVSDNDPYDNSLASESTITRRGYVKWFNFSKNYGFLVPEGGGADILIHQSCLNRAKIEHLHEGDFIECKVIQTPRGYQTIEILSTIPHQIDDSNALAANDQRGPITDIGDFERVIVKWFDRIKGYGFLNRLEGSSDIFIHIKVLQRAVIETLNQGEMIYARFGHCNRGLIAVDIYSNTASEDQSATEPDAPDAEGLGISIDKITKSEQPVPSSSHDQLHPALTNPDCDKTQTL